MNIIIIGYGEIGKSLEKCYLDFKDNFSIKIIEKNYVIGDEFDDCDVLNICIPYHDESFVDIVFDYIIKLNPKNIIIHSTIPPNTTDLITSKVSHMEINEICHSPVRGVHPNLYEGLKTFVKYIGPSKGSGESVLSHFSSLKINAEILANSTTTELAKILCTTYYDMCIAFHNDINNLCKKYDVEFNNVATKWNTTYNNGYEKLGMRNVVRPVLYPPTNQKIGGHCVIPNAELCKKHFNMDVLDYIIKLS